MNEIVDLIKALSPVEKQHFKKRHNPDSDFVVLFDFVNKNKSCHNADALKYLTKKKLSSKKLTSSYLSVVKSYLKDKILESLRVQLIHKKRNYEMLSRSMNTDVLIEKGLYGIAKSEIESSLSKNVENSFPIEKLLLLRRKSLLAYFENYNGINIDGIEALFDKRLEAAEQLILEIKFARILSILSFQYFNGENDEDLLQSFMKEPYMQDESLSTDFSTRYLFHWVHAQFQEFKGNSSGALDHFNKSIRIWLDNPHYIEAHSRMYLGACFTYFKYLIHHKDPFSNLLSEINFDNLLANVKAENLSPEEEKKHRFVFGMFEVLSLRQRGMSVEIIELVSPIIARVKFLEDQPDFEQVVFGYYAAHAYFDIGDFKTSGDLLFSLINPLDQRLASNPVYISVFILLYLLNLLESGNEKLLRYQLPKCKKFLKQEGHFTKFEDHYFSMISQLISPRFKLTPEFVFQRFYKRLTQAQTVENRGIKIEYDYLVNWVKKKEKELMD